MFRKLSGHDIAIIALSQGKEYISLFYPSLLKDGVIDTVSKQSVTFKARRKTPETVRIDIQHGDVMPIQVEQ